MSTPESLRGAIAGVKKGHRLYWVRELDVVLFEDLASGSLLFFSSPSSAVFRLADVDKSVGVARSTLATAINTAMSSAKEATRTIPLEPAMAILPPEVTIAALPSDSEKRLLDWRATSVANVVRARANTEFLTRVARIVEMLRSFKHGNLLDHARLFRSDRIRAEAVQHEAGKSLDTATRLADVWSSTVSRDAADAIVAELLDTSDARLVDNDGVARRMYDASFVKEELSDDNTLVVAVPRKEWEAFSALYKQ